MPTTTQTFYHCGHDLIIINVHSPTEDKDDELKDEFYNEPSDIPTFEVTRGQSWIDLTICNKKLQPSEKKFDVW